MIVFIPKVNSQEISKVVPCSFSLMLTLNWGIDMLFQKLIPEKGEWIWKTPSALCFWQREFHVKPELAWKQVNRIGVGENYVCCFAIVVIFMGLRGAKT